MTRKERKIICPLCHRSISSDEYAAHTLTHKGKHHVRQSLKLPNQGGAQTVIDSERKFVQTYPCVCGAKFGSRKDLWTHIETCKTKIIDSRKTCSICSKPGEIFLSLKDIGEICPSCSLGHFGTKTILGVPVINHMGIEYEKAFEEHANSLLKYLNVQSLKELGINMAVITFSVDHSTTYCLTPKGELVFIVDDKASHKEMNFESFRSVVTHEIFHAYITNILKLGIDKLQHPLTAVGASAIQLAEDIELIKITFEKNVVPLLQDEANRTIAYYRNLSNPVPLKYLSTFPDRVKFGCTMSVTWAYASTEWLKENTKDEVLKQQFLKGLELIRPHYVANGFPKFKNLITELLSSNVVQTKEEAEIVFQRILGVYGEYLEDANLALY